MYLHVGNLLQEGGMFSGEIEKRHPEAFAELAAFAIKKGLILCAGPGPAGGLPQGASVQSVEPVVLAR
jgi:hypothetical protein